MALDGAFWIERIDGLAPVEPEIHLTFGTSSRAASRSIWDIFNREGRFEGTVVLPPRFTPMAVEERAVVGVEKDSLDVEFVVRYRVVCFPHSQDPRLFSSSRVEYGNNPIRYPKPGWQVGFGT